MWSFISYPLGHPNAMWFFEQVRLLVSMPCGYFIRYSPSILLCYAIVQRVYSLGYPVWSLIKYTLWSSFYARSDVSQGIPFWITSLYSVDLFHKVYPLHPIMVMRPSHKVYPQGYLFILIWQFTRLYLIGHPIMVMCSFRKVYSQGHPIMVIRPYHKV